MLSRSDAKAISSASTVTVPDSTSTPIDCVSCSRNVRWVCVNAWSEASSMTAFVSPSKSTGRTTMFFGVAEPRLELTLV